MRHFRSQLDAAKALDRTIEFVNGQKQFSRWQQRPRLVAAQQAVTRLGVLPEMLDRTAHVAVQHDRRSGRKVVGDGGRRVEEQRQVILDAAGNDAVGDVLVQRGLRRVAFEHLAEAAAKARATRVIQRKLARRKQAHVRHRVERALGVDVEGLNRLDLGIEEVDAIGQRRAHGKEIDETAADAELTRRHDLGHMRVAGERQLRAQRVDIERLALREKKRECRQVARRREAIQSRGGSDDQQVALATRGPVHGREPLRHQVLVR